MIKNKSLYIKNINLAMTLDQNNIYILAISGGVDSMSLLDFLNKLHYKIIVVHFNHLMRKEALKDKVLVQNYCQKNQITFHYFELQLSKKNFQNQARCLRKNKIKEIAIQYQTYHIITAHHLDDLTETIFLKLIRGSSLKGYSGMQPIFSEKNFLFYKPFLYLSKKTIYDYAKKYQVPFLEDYTNHLNTYDRNKIRHQVIPPLKKIRNLSNNIQNFHTQITEASLFIREQTLFFKKKQIKPNIFNLSDFLNLHIAIQKDLILLLLEENQIAKNFVFIQNILKNLKNKNKPCLSYYLNNNWILKKTYDDFSIISVLSPINNQLITLKPLLNCCFSPYLLFFCSLQAQINLDSNKITFPLFLRQKKTYDILQFPFGTQKLTKFFINRKIPLSQRKQIWFVVDQNNIIIWIPNLYINKNLGNEKTCYLGLYINPINSSSVEKPK